MTFEEADWWIGHWAGWSRGNDGLLRKLKASSAKWQMDYRAGFDPENKKISNKVMHNIDANLLSCIDRVMAALLNSETRTEAEAFFVWWERSTARYAATQFTVSLDEAYSTFEFKFEQVLSKREQMSFNTTRRSGGAFRP